MSKHTPGPWKYREDGAVYVPGLDPGANWIADVRTVANGRLIAAAPDLLEACEAMLRDDGTYVETMALASAAIAKAKGKQ